MSKDVTTAETRQMDVPATITEMVNARGARVARGRCLGFAAIEDEWRAFGSGAALVPLLATAPLRVTGADRHEFVHGQLSNEVKRLKVGERSPNLLLNVKGHALAQVEVCRREQDLFLAVEDGAGARVQEHFRRHIVFDQVTIEDLSGTIASLSVQGPSAREVMEAAVGESLGELDEARFVQPPFASAKLLVLAKRRSFYGGYDLHVLTRDAVALVAALEAAGATLAGEEALEAARIAAGIAKASSEAGEGVLPQEAGLDAAVSYRKGCYLGQEIMARIEARGKVRRRLVGLRLSGWPEEATRELLLDGKAVGRRGDAAQHPGLGVIALAVLRREFEPPLALEVGGVKARLVALPFEA